MRRARLACLCACLSVVLFPACQQAAEEEAKPAAAAPPPAGQSTPKLRLPEGQHVHHQHEGMNMDLDGAVNENRRSCPRLPSMRETCRSGNAGRSPRGIPGRCSLSGTNGGGACTRAADFH